MPRRRRLFEECLSLRRGLGDRPGEAWALSHLGGVARSLGRPAEARALLEDSLALFRKVGDRLGSAWALCHLGGLDAVMGSPTDAWTRLSESLTLFHELGDAEGLVAGLSAFAVLFVRDVPSKAARLWGASQSVGKSLGLPVQADTLAEYEPQILQARSALGDDAFALAWEQGCAFTGEQAVSYALEETQTASPNNSHS